MYNYEKKKYVHITVTQFTHCSCICTDFEFFFLNREKKSKKIFLTLLTGRQMAATVLRQVHIPPIHTVPRDKRLGSEPCEIVLSVQQNVRLLGASLAYPHTHPRWYFRLFYDHMRQCSVVLKHGFSFSASSLGTFVVKCMSKWMTWKKQHVERVPIIYRPANPILRPRFGLNFLQLPVLIK